MRVSEAQRDGKSCLPAGRRARAQTIAGRFLLVLLGLTSGVLLLEASLHLLAWRLGRDPAPVLAGQGKTVLLAVGDSNTYGLYLREEEAYPAVLSRLWRDQGERPPLAVVNLGYPGMNSTLLASQFGRVLQELRPRVVTLMLGVNDFWTIPMPARGEDAAGERLRRWFWQHVRTYRLLYFLFRSADLRLAHVPQDLRRVRPGEFFSRWSSRARVRVGESELQLGFEMDAAAEAPASVRETTLAANLAAMVEEARRSGACVLLLTYAADGGLYWLANKITRRVAGELGVGLVDLAATFAPRCPVRGEGSLVASKSHCPQYLFPDQHPTALGHREIALRLFEPVRSCLR